MEDEIFEEELNEELTDISELGHLEATLSAFGHTFKLKTLNTFEKVYIAKEMGKYSQSFVLSYAYPREVIAFSLIEFDGEKFKGVSAEETKNCLERADAVRRVINNWSFNIIAFLFNNVYSELAKKEDEIIDELKKKAVILNPSWLSLNTETAKDSIQEEQEQDTLKP